MHYGKRPCIYHMRPAHPPIPDNTPKFTHTHVHTHTDNITYNTHTHNSKRRGGLFAVTLQTTTGLVAANQPQPSAAASGWWQVQVCNKSTS